MYFGRLTSEVLLAFDSDDNNIACLLLQRTHGSVIHGSRNTFMMCFIKIEVSYGAVVLLSVLTVGLSVFRPLHLDKMIIGLRNRES